METDHCFGRALGSIHVVATDFNPSTGFIKVVSKSRKLGQFSSRCFNDHLKKETDGLN
jgi:hypothetical protein